MNPFSSYVEFLYIVILTLIAFLVRILVTRNATVGYDTYGHLYYAKEVRSQSAGPFSEIKVKVSGSTGFRHPFLWHWILGSIPLPFETIIRCQKWINPLIDAGFSILIYFFARWATLGHGIAFLITLSYLFTPMWFSRLSIGPRVDSLTPRLTSELVSNLFFILLLLPIGIPSWLAWICGILLSAFVLLSSKFGVQAMLFLVPITSLFTRNWILIAALFGGIGLSFILTRGGFYLTFRRQLRHLTSYFKNNLKGQTPISNRNSLKKLLAKPSHRTGFAAHIGVIIMRFIYDNSYTSIVAKMPVIIAAFICYGSAIYSKSIEVPLHIHGPVLSATIVFLLINLPPLLFLGEAERYLNHVAFFIVSMLTTLAVELKCIWVIWILIGYGLIYWTIEFFFLHKIIPQDTKIKQIDTKIISYLRSIPNPSTILSYPYDAGGGYYRVMLETDHNVIFLHNNEFGATFGRTHNYSADYPYIRLEKMSELSHEMGANILILRVASLLKRGFDGWTPPCEWQKVDIGGPIYEVYRKISD